ncbi:MAG: hypothetical protein ACTSUE_02080 [Promethearchaeota archaeon]
MGGVPGLDIQSSRGLKGGEGFKNMITLQVEGMKEELRDEGRWKMEDGRAKG